MPTTPMLPARPQRSGASLASCRDALARFIAALVALLPASIFAADGDTRGVGEYALKAAFLFNFAQFVEWPPSALPSPQAPLVIGILGNDPFGDSLDSIVRGERISGHPLEVHRYQDARDIDACHVLFVSRSESGVLEAILQELRGRPILTVADFSRFGIQGGMIQFVKENNRIRFQINLDAAREAGLTISSKLLRPAEIIKTRKG